MVPLVLGAAVELMLDKGVTPVLIGAVGPVPNSEPEDDGDIGAVPVEFVNGALLGLTDAGGRPELGGAVVRAGVTPVLRGALVLFVLVGTVELLVDTGTLVPPVLKGKPELGGKLECTLLAFW